MKASKNANNRKQIYLLSIILFIVLLLKSVLSFAQGKNHQWLIGYQSGALPYSTSLRARFEFTQNNAIIVPDSFKMAFDPTQANICDENGNFLFASNGTWIMDASYDTMQNGSGLNPNSYTNDFIEGLPIPHGNIILPMPNDSLKFVLIHQTANYNAQLSSTEIYMSIVDMSLNGGLGVVIQKNVIIFQDTLDWGLAACKHANGRDWWIVACRTNCDSLISFLLDPTGIHYSSAQSFGLPPTYVNVSQPTFSMDGSKFAVTSTYGITPGNWYHDVRIYEFDRCTGIFSSLSNFTLDMSPGFSIAFSPNSKYLYTSSFQNIYQIKLDTIDIMASKRTVASNDGFYSPIPPFQTDFWLMYLAANGKIYVTPGSSVVDIHCINQPDSSGIQCDVQQHSIHFPTWTNRGNVYHPNYYLGPEIGSACDTLAHVGIYELDGVKNVTLKPNPSYNGNFCVSYMLPQNKSGILLVNDMMGKQVFEMSLPPWSSLQDLSLSGLKSGVYSVTIESENTRMSKRLVIIH